MKFRISHGLQSKTIVEGAQEAGNMVAAMVRAGLTNILVSKEENPVTVTQLDRADGDVPDDAICRLIFDVTALRPE